MPVTPSPKEHTFDKPQYVSDQIVGIYYVPWQGVKEGYTKICRC